MDFSNNIFQPATSSTSVSNDTMSHTQMVMACRFGWTALPDNNTQTSLTNNPMPSPAPLTTAVDTSRTKRFTPCRGRLYHQLTCSHRIRTDFVEDCGSNCLDPISNTTDVAFYCQECVQIEANNIWKTRETEHNASYPPMDQMDTEQYQSWYNEHRQLEIQFSKDRRTYEMELESKTRPSNYCSALEASKDEVAFAAGMDSLSLALVASNDSTTEQASTRTNRKSLPCDASEQLHWGLNALSLDRGFCGVEYSANPTHTGTSASRTLDEEELWRKPRDRG